MPVVSDVWKAEAGKSKLKGSLGDLGSIVKYQNPKYELPFLKLGIEIIQIVVGGSC